MVEKPIPFEKFAKNVTPDPVGIAGSEDAIALEFAKLHANKLRYVAPWGCWMAYDGGRWQKESTGNAYDLARPLCRDAASAEKGDNVRRKMANAATVAGVERMAKTDRRLVATVDQWDADPWLLNTPEGTVDLRSGEMRVYRLDDYITKTTAVAPGGDCPIWYNFLKRITDDNVDLSSFLQRVAGYSLTGSTREHAMFFAFGPGANGKSVAINTIAGMIGDYHRTAPMEVFTASNTDRHPTELAMLRGARLVTSIETEEGRSWAESRIKSLTGGDTIVARFMRQDFFEFTPQFKLLIAGNHKPSLQSVDEAIRRRLHLIPFTVTIPPDERDPDLFDKLKEEWPGILTWAIEGAADWYNNGLQPPEQVREATDDYLAEEDSFETWCEECTKADSNAWESTSDLFRSWSGWAKKSGETIGSERKFSQLPAGKEFKRKRKDRARGFFGLRIIRSDYTDNARYGG